MKKTLLTLFLLTPLSVFAALPAFPMAFYGSVTINGGAAPVGTIIKTYYDTTLAGEVTVKEEGIYGYDNPLKQQLLVSAGTGTLRFTTTASGINSGTETQGDALQSHSVFTSGESVSKDLAFTWTPPAPPPPPPAPSPAPAPSSSGGGGGGSTAVSVLYGCMDPKATNYSSIANRDNGACLYPAATTTVAVKATTTTLIAASTTPKSQAPQGEVLGAATVYTPPTPITTVFTFTKNLTVGAKGSDVTELQKRLTTDGFYTGPITGFFGPLTAQAVKKYQAKHGLEAVGNLGPKTRAVLNQSTGVVLGAATTIALPNPSQMTAQARQALIAQLLAMILELQKQLEVMKGGSR